MYLGLKLKHNFNDNNYVHVLYIIMERYFLHLKQLLWVSFVLCSNVLITYNKITLLIHRERTNSRWMLPLTNPSYPLFLSILGLGEEAATEACDRRHIPNPAELVLA